MTSLSKACFLTLATDDDDMGLVASAVAVVVVAAAASGFIVACFDMLCASRLCSPIERPLTTDRLGPQPEAAFFLAVAQLMMMLRGGDGGLGEVRRRTCFFLGGALAQRRADAWLRPAYLKKGAYSCLMRVWIWKILGGNNVDRKRDYREPGNENQKQKSQSVLV